MRRSSLYKYLEPFEAGLYRIRPNKKKEFFVRAGLLGVSAEDFIVYIVTKIGVPSSTIEVIDIEKLLKEIDEKHRNA